MMPSSSNTDRWERTNLRLVAQNDSSSNSATREEEYYLCLPTSSSDSSRSESIVDETKNDSDDDQQQQLRARRLLQFMALDRYLASVTQLADSTRQLLLSAVQNHHRPKVITSSNSGRVINVLQGEIAHCTPSQADVLVSDDATTCHILGLWSRLCYFSSSSAHQHYQMQQQPRDEGGGSASPLATLAHIDSPHYQDCIKDAVNLHYQYHCSQLPHEQQQQQRTQLNGGDTFLPVIELSIHLMGGYNDNDGTSHEITDGVLRALSNVSDDYVSRQPRLQMTLQTCAVLSANDNGSGCPIGRGLALDVSSGRVYLAEVEEEDLEFSSPQVNTTVGSTASTVVTTASAKGPDCLLRSARLWASFFFNNSHDNDSGNIQRKLQTVHNPNNDCLYIYPFYFAPHPYPQQMLTLNDARLLQYTSSSPEVEKDNFVRCVRETFKYMNRTSCFHVFKKRETDEEGDENDGWDYGWDDGDYLPRRYRRVGLNGWAIVA